ncbi:MAG: transglycosylase SLT domain-containing protein [Alistipes sp.]|nr:transglycosylase SLT domain-containing protein [Alistipes sp.]
MRKITIKAFALLLAAFTIASPAEAQIFKKEKKVKPKVQLAIERQRADSLASLVEEYRQRESDWQRAWHDEKDERKLMPSKGLLTVDYTPAQVDSLHRVLKLQQVNDTFQAFFEEYICEAENPSTDTAMDSLYKARLDLMITPIHLPYNELVRDKIRVYTNPSGVMSRVLARSKYYFPMIEEELLKAGMPVELRALAIIESALIPTAISRAGAAGLWQFMPSTGKSYGLEINTMIDERMDPVKSTRAACKYLKVLYNMYNDWSLALAAYNCGPGNVNKALARAGGKPESFWDVYWHLPRETRGYVPAFIAATYAYAYHQAHNIEYNEPPLPIAVDTIHIDRLMHMKQITSTIDVDSTTLAMLNPQYKLEVIPATTKPYTLILPANRITEYITKQDSIFAKDSTFLKEYLNPAAVQKKMQETAVIYHKVKSGETLGAIAKKYRVTTKQIMTWNKLKNANVLSVGQRLRIEKR